MPMIQGDPTGCDAVSAAAFLQSVRYRTEAKITLNASENRFFNERAQWRNDYRRLKSIFKKVVTGGFF
jgi:hypothetical protein